MNLDIKKKNKVQFEFVVCPYCGYNNEKSRCVNKYGTCLRCNKVIDQKAYIKRRLWEANNKRKIKEGFDYYESFNSSRFK